MDRTLTGNLFDGGSENPTGTPSPYRQEKDKITSKKVGFSNES